MRRHRALHPFAALALLAAPLRAQVVISEIHYHPVEEPAFNADGTPVLNLADDVHEFIELQNAGAVPMDISGWTVSGGVDFIIPAGSTIPAGGFRVVAKYPARIETVYGLAAGSVLGPFTGKLGNDGDTVTVKNASGATVDEVAWSAQFPWAMSANALGAQDRFTGLSSLSLQYKGRSLQRVSVAANSNDPANWLASPLSGPTPGLAQSVTRSVPKPVVIAQSRTQSNNGAAIIRAVQPVTVTATFSSTASLTDAAVEYFVDDVNSTTETRTTVTMTAFGGGVFTASLPGQVDRSIVRYRFRANRGGGLEVVSPRADDPQIAPVGAGGAREAWHGYFVTPARTSANAIYDLLVANAQFSQMGTNITQNPKRTTTATATGLPREVPWVAATAPRWNGTVPAVFACNGEVRDIQLRYHGSRYHRATTNLSFKIHFPEHQPFRDVTSFFVNGHTSNTAETQKMYRLLDLPSSLTRTVDWYFNSNALITRLEHGEYERHVLEEWTARQQQLNPGTAREDTGEFYKAIGNIDASQNNNEGPYTKGDQAPMLANAGWTQLQRFEWTYSLQNNAWKGHTPFRDMVQGMWSVRGDTPQSPSLAGNATNLAATKAWFQTNFDVEATLTALAVCQWTGIWDDTGHNQFFWRRANGKWVRLPWDFDDTMTGARASQSIYSNESGVSVFNGPNWWKDTFFKCFRNEFRQRLWELNNSFFEPANLTANGLTTAASFAATRLTNVNSQVGLGTFNKPARPVNSLPANASSIVGGAALTASTYSHPTARPHGSSKWEIRTAAGEFEEPEVRLTSTTSLTSLPVPFDQLTYGQTYFWRVTYYDADGHASIVSAETSFTYGTASTVAGTLVLNEILADNRAAAESGGTHPDFIELRNNGAATATLAGLSLTDNPLVPAKFTFPAGTTLAAGASLVIWCDSALTTPGIQSGFGIDADGQTVLLLNGSTILDAVTFGPQAPDISIGRIVNGTGGWQANTPTPGTANIAKTLGSTANLRINEWMASPAYGDDWFEIHNTDANPVALGGLLLSDEPGTPAITAIPALSFIAGKGFTKFLGDGSSAGGHHANFKLGGGGDNLVLTAASGTATLDLVTFGAQTPDMSQGRLPDGGTTVISFNGSNSPARSNWSPGPIVINEALTNSTAPFVDMIELHNPSAAPVSIGGWWLSDDQSAPQKFQIPSGTTIAAGGYAVFTEGQFNAGTSPFSLSSLGEEIILYAVDGGGALTGYRAQANFGAAAENVSFGRVPVTGGAEFWPLVAQTFDAANAAPKTTPIIVNEVMYHPLDGAGGTDNTRDEFIELHNPAASALDVGGWRIKGDSDFTFPAGSSIAGGAYALIVSFDPANTATLTDFLTHYGLTAAAPVFGPYSPKLNNGTQNIELAYPGPLTGPETPFINVDKVEYRDIAPWPVNADGTGQSLQRQSRTVIGNDPANWSAAAPTPGAVNDGVITELTIISDTTLPGGVAGLAFAHALAAAGGTPPYVWTLNGGTLPGGVTLAGDGLLNGTPAAAGTFIFTAQVTDGVSAVKTKSLSLTIAATALQITTSSLPDGTFGISYSQTLTATGGNPAYVWSLSAGALPGGLSLSNAGIITGTPGVPGTFNFTARASDSGGLAATRNLSVTVPVPPLTILSASPVPNATAGTLYSQALLAAGGVAPYTWTVSAGSLPGGVTLSSAGDLGGTPAAAGIFNFTAQLTDGAATVRTRGFALTVAPAPLVITSTETLSGSIIGDPYSQSLAATGGTLPYSWTLITGELPAGISLNSSGLISGSATEPGTFNFVARNADGGGQVATKSFSLTITTSGPLDHFSWDYAPSAPNAGTPFGAQLRARDAQSRTVTDFSGSVNLSAASGSGSLANQVLITEVTHEVEDQFEIQNVSSMAANTTGWFVRVSDNTTNINLMSATVLNLPVSLASGAMLRVSEQNIAGRTYFGSAINWNTTTPRGWVMLFDAGSNLRDFFAFGWSAADVSGLSVVVNGRTVTAAGQWSGAGAVQGTLGNINLNTDSWQRTGSSDSNTSAAWPWSLNGATLGANNTGLTLPWTTATPVSMIPAGVTLTDGMWLGNLSITQAATTVRLTATSASVTGSSAPFDVAAALADTDGDGIPDTYESTHGLNPALNDTALDADKDGSSNAAEFRFGTDPQSAASVPVITAASLTAAGALTITWPAAAGKVYRIATSTDSVIWEYVPVLATGDGLKSATILAGGEVRLFVKVELAP